MKTFKECADSYIENGGETRYINKIIEYFKDKYVTEIYPFDIRKMADELFLIIQILLKIGKL